MSLYKHQDFTQEILFLCSWCKESWDIILFFPLVKNAPVYSMLKEIMKEAMKLLFFSFREFKQLFSDFSNAAPESTPDL